MPAGRPSTYTDELADEICSQLSDGVSLRSICRQDDMPAASSVFKWLRENDRFSEQYTKAKEESADALVEDMLDIADNDVADVVLVDGVPLVVDGEMVKQTHSAKVAHARLRVDTRKWAASKLKPKKYGDKLDLNHSGSFNVTLESDADNL